MITTKETVKLIEEYDYNLYRLAEDFIEKTRELEEKIEELKMEQIEHNCE